MTVPLKRCTKEFLSSISYRAYIVLYAIPVCEAAEGVIEEDAQIEILAILVLSFVHL